MNSLTALCEMTNVVSFQTNDFDTAVLALIMEFNEYEDFIPGDSEIVVISGKSKNVPQFSGSYAILVTHSDLISEANKALIAKVAAANGSRIVFMYS